MTTLTRTELTNHYRPTDRTVNGTVVYVPREEQTYCATCGHDVPVSSIDPDDATGDYSHDGHPA